MRGARPLIQCPGCEDVGQRPGQCTEPRKAGSQEARGHRNGPCVRRSEQRGCLLEDSVSRRFWKEGWGTVEGTGRLHKEAVWKGMVVQVWPRPDQDSCRGQAQQPLCLSLQKTAWPPWPPGTWSFLHPRPPMAQALWYFTEPANPIPAQASPLPQARPECLRSLQTPSPFRSFAAVDIAEGPCGS